MILFLARATETVASTAAAAYPAAATAASDGPSRYAALSASTAAATKPTAEDGETSAGKQSWTQTSPPAGISIMGVSRKSN